MLQAPAAQRAEVGGEAERGDDRLCLYGVPRRPCALTCTVLHDARRRRARSTCVGDDTVDAVAPCGDGGRRGRGTVAAVHERDRARERLERQRPVEGAVAAADDEDVLAGVLRKAGTK